MRGKGAVCGLVAACCLGLGSGWAAGQDLTRPNRQNRNRAEPLAIVSDTSLDDWAFGDAAGARRFRDHLERMLQKKVAQVEQLFVLTPLQRQKLTLAGHGDIKRLLETVDDARQEFQRARNDAARLAEVRKSLRTTLHLAVAFGPFELGSFFDKTLRKMFDDKQLQKKPLGKPNASEGP